jgi:hypothetical protein
MATVIHNTAAVTSTSPDLNGNKKIDTIVIATDNSENTMTIKQHHNDEGECEENREIMRVSFNVIDKYVNRRRWTCV